MRHETLGHWQFGRVGCIGLWLLGNSDLAETRIGFENWDMWVSKTHSRVQSCQVDIFKVTSETRSLSNGKKTRPSSPTLR